MGQNTETVLKGQMKPQDSFRKWMKAHYLHIALGVIIMVPIVSSIMLYLSTVVITEVIETEETITFGTKYENDNNLELRVEQIKQNGENGIRRVFTEKKKHLLSNEEISSTVIKTEVTKEPINKIIVRGTKRATESVASNYVTNSLTPEQQRQLALRQAEYDEWARRSLEESQQRNKEFLDTWLAGIDESAARFEAEMQRINQDSQQGVSGGSESACRDKANRAGQNFQRVLGAQGAGGSSAAIYGAQQVIDSTYRDCMNGN